VCWADPNMQPVPNKNVRRNCQLDFVMPIPGLMERKKSRQLQPHRLLLLMLLLLLLEQLSNVELVSRSLPLNLLAAY
jgi:hypothetical protein